MATPYAEALASFRALEDGKLYGRSPMQVVTGSQYCPHTPTEKQQAFLDLDCLEALYGGAAGPGKTDALLMSALKYVHVPGYSALILRRDFPRLAMAGAIMDRAIEWLSMWRSTIAWSSSAKTFRFPSGAVLTFGYIDSPEDRYRYASAEFQFIGWDELTEFRLSSSESNPYTFMFSRLRKTADLDVPLRVRAASNPGNIGHDFVKRRFISDEALETLRAGGTGVFYADEAQERAFVPALLKDNPFINRAEYERGLQHLPPVTRARLLAGDWSVIEDALIPSAWLRYYLTRGDMLCALDGEGDQIRGLVINCNSCKRLVTVDTAGTSAQKASERKGREASWSVAQVWDFWPQQDVLFLRHIWRERVEWDGLKAGVSAVLEQWQPGEVWIENAHHGPPLAAEMRREHGPGRIKLVSPTTKEMRGQSGTPGKVERATSLLSMLSEGKVFLPVEALWLNDLESEWISWTGDDDQTTDQIDAAAYAAHRVRRQVGPRVFKMGGPMMLK